MTWWPRHIKKRSLEKNKPYGTTFTFEKITSTITGRLQRRQRVRRPLGVWDWQLHIRVSLGLFFWNTKEFQSRLVKSLWVEKGKEMTENCRRYSKSGGLWDPSDDCCRPRCTLERPCGQGEVLCLWLEIVTLGNPFAGVLPLWMKKVKWQYWHCNHFELVNYE